MQPFISIGPFTVQAQPFVILAGFVLASIIANKRAGRFGLNADFVGNMVFYAALVGLAAARLGYVLLNLSAYAREPLSAFAPSVSALSSFTGIPAALAFGVWYARRKRIFGWALADALAIPALVFAAALALGTWFDGSVFGTATPLPWAANVWGEMRHPVQVYEIVLIFALALALWRAKKPSGQAALLALAGYAFIRVFVDGFRADDVSLVLGLRATQLLFLALGIGALWVWAERRAKTQGGASL